MEKKEYVKETYMKTEKKCIKEAYYCDKCGKHLATNLPSLSDFTNRKYKNVMFYEITYTQDHYFDYRDTDDYCEDCAKEKVESLIDRCNDFNGGMDDYSFEVEPVIVRDFGEYAEF